MTEWERKTHMKPVRELRGVKRESCNPPTCPTQQWDSKIQTRRTVLTKQASAFWKWHLQYEKEQAQ